MVTSVRPQRCQPFPFSLITISLITFRFVSLPSIFPSTLYPPLPFIPLSDWVWPMRPPLHDPGGPRPPSVIPHRPDTSQMPSEALPPQIYLQQCTGGACAGPFPRNAQQVQKPTPLPLSDLPQGIFLQFHLQCSHEDAYWREALWGKKGGEVCVCVRLHKKGISLSLLNHILSFLYKAFKAFNTCISNWNPALPDPPWSHPFIAVAISLVLDHGHLCSVCPAGVSSLPVYLWLMAGLS